MKNHCIALTCVSIILASCNRTPQEASTVIEPDSESTILEASNDVLKNAELGFCEAKQRDIHEKITAYGEILPHTDKMASIVSRIEGIVLEVNKQLGDAVDEGEVVAVLESQKLAESVMAYLQAETQFEAARKAFAREKELFDKKLTSAEAYQGAEQSLQTAKIAHAAARQSLQLLHFEESELHDYLDSPEHADLTKFAIRSPLKGVITKRNLHRGEAVTADTALFEVADLEEVCVNFKVPLSAIGNLKTDQDIDVIDDTLGRSNVGRVTFISPIANETSRTVMVRASLANKEGHWRPGTPVSVALTGTVAAANIAVPVESLLDYEGGYVVFVRKSDNAFELRDVTPGRSDDIHVEIKTGLQRGETVVTTNAFALKALWQSQGA